MLKSRHHVFGPDRRMPDTRASSRKNSISYRRRNRSGRRLAQANRCFVAWKEFDLDFRHVPHTQDPIAVQVCIPGLPFGELRSLVQG
jgi:hypothetical protein